MLLTYLFNYPLTPCHKTAVHTTLKVNSAICEIIGDEREQLTWLRRGATRVGLAPRRHQSSRDHSSTHRLATSIIVNVVIKFTLNSI